MYVSNSGSAGGPGGAGPQSAWYVDSNVAPSSYSSGLPYTPLAKASPEQWVAFDLVAPASKVKISIDYAMSVSDGGSVALQVDYLRVADGQDPNAVLTTQSTFTFAPGAGTTRKSVGPAQSATLEISVAEGETVYVRVTRKNVGGDTHPGSFNFLNARLEV